jgi:hypothetical protein
MTGNFTDDVVDDSEPEREQWRRERKKIISSRSLHKPATTREVIELTDDESEGDQLQSATVIDISGNSAIFQLRIDY